MKSFLLDEFEYYFDGKSWLRECPSCGVLIIYTIKSNMKRSLRLKRLCRSCATEKGRKHDPLDKERFCPRCNCVIKYTSVCTKIRAQTDGGVCRSCALYLRDPVSEATRRKMSQSALGARRTEQHKSNISKGLAGGRAAKYWLGKKRPKEAIERGLVNRAWYRPSEETKRKIGKNNSLAWQKKRFENGWDGIVVTKGQLQTWRRKVLKRDWHRCQFCASEQSLHAHHIKPKLYYPELALDIKNGLALCRDCHYFVHYGEAEHV